MRNIIKLMGIILGALVLGGVIGWAFNMAGYETPVTVAVILAIFTAISSMKKKVRN